ncbi:DUF2334 domain-containing protein [Clostridium tyrobutyricum]|uniref:DUF2334 domain-containing protein n=1 Tax=Clostridium tyrobutyricum TaxID=1519 RepID=UPI001C386F8D|nr:DUF2334 domain-containing protein [Clostridium tyrobutyricum]MBV4419792.1 DUF2334 domain-containing protein [Clostridium tyrobutyricum]
MFKALKKTVLTSMILFFTVITFQCIGNFVLAGEIYRFNSKNSGSGNVYMLIDKVYPFVDLNDFVEKVDFLHDNGISFICSVMPVYDNKDLDAMKRFCQVLRYAQSKGGRIIMHSSVIQGEDVSGKDLKVKMDSAEKIYVDYGVYPMALDVSQELFTRKDYRELVNSSKYIFVEKDVEKGSSDTAFRINVDLPLNDFKVSVNNMIQSGGHFRDVDYLNMDIDMGGLKLTNLGSYIFLNGKSVSEVNVPLKSKEISGTVKPHEKVVDITGANRKMIVITSGVCLVFIVIVIISRRIDVRKFFK